jgi:hypothetical protein
MKTKVLVVMISINSDVNLFGIFTNVKICIGTVNEKLLSLGYDYKEHLNYIRCLDHLKTFDNLVVKTSDEIVKFSIFYKIVNNAI